MNLADQQNNHETKATDAQSEQTASRNNEENELEAEQESAEAMDADVPQPAGADETTEGQPT